MDFSEEMTDEILKIFQVESEEIISKINNSLLILEKNPNNRDAILMLFRDAHTLKGASRMVGFNNVQTIAHKIEDVLGLAKENKVLLNAKVVDILYKAIDLLSTLIQKSIEKGKDAYNEDVPKLVTILGHIEEYTDEFKDTEQSDFDADLLAQNMDNINKLIPEGLFILMKIEMEKDEADLIKDFLICTKNLYSIFEKVGPYEIKKWLEDINVKLEFITKASNNLLHDEIEEIHKKLDNVINNLISICDLYNIKVIDYYSIVFDKISTHPTSSQATTNQVIEVIEQKDLTEYFTPKIEVQEPITNQIEMCTSDNLGCIQEKISALPKNISSPVEIKDSIINFEKTCTNEDVQNIFHKIILILDFISKNEIKLDEETALILSQSIGHCDDILKNKTQNTDNELIFQRLEIIQQVLELNTEQESRKYNAGKYKIKNKKLNDFTEIFDTGEIKTLRVDSSKLDSLVNQVNELTIAKIKTKKHIHEFNMISKELEDWQKTSAKVLNYLRYYDKKYLQSDNPTSFFVKQLLSTFIENNKKIQETINGIDSINRTIQDDDAKMNLIVDNVDQMVKNIRILPFATVFHLFGRMVRDIANEKNKKVELEIIGSETSTDKKIIEEIKTPLIHIIRNAIDHGIEMPEERIALGKNAIGKIILRAKQAENKVIIEIEDDGKGLNLEKIKNKALNNGYLTQEEVGSMTDEQITNLIFMPGFSTGEEITNISGRGIGLDIVQTKITQLNGTVRMISEINKGCCVQIEIPSKMSTINAFVVKSSNQVFAIPINVIKTVLRKELDEIRVNKGKKSIIHDEKTIPLHDLANILNLEKLNLKKTKETILIIETDKKTFALTVDELIGNQEILLKKLSAPFYKLKNILGITSLISGEICLILNIKDIIDSINYLKMQKILPAHATKTLPERTFNIIIVDDSVTTRTLGKNILTKLGYAVETAQNPREAFVKMKQINFDLILSDIAMPEMDGIEFLKELKTNEMYGDIPVIVVSSVSNDNTEKLAIELGVKKYFLKSEFNQDYFQETIRKVLYKEL